MNELTSFASALRDRVAKYDLLSHPFYQAWSAGKLTRNDLRQYACEYYHHVAAFPTYLSAFHSRLPDGPLRRRVLMNLCGEEIEGRPHSELWLDFAEGMGANREHAKAAAPTATAEAISWFRNIARERTPSATLAALWAYESQVPRVAEAKEKGLREWYGADDKTCAYFTLHKTADVHHARVWEELLDRELSTEPSQPEAALDAAESAARSLWQVLDGIEEQRKLTAA